MTPDISLYAALHADEADPAYADCTLSADDDIGIHAGAWVEYNAPNSCYRFEGEAITYDAATDRWLCEWRDFTGKRTDWVGAERLTLLMTAEVAALVARNGVA